MSKTQTTLTSSEKHLVRTIRTEDSRQACPDCRQDVAPSKGGQKANGIPTHGWRCDLCNNVMPCNSGPEARSPDPHDNETRIVYEGGPRGRHVVEADSEEDPAQ